MNIGLYVHIPFCQQKCFYCDFPSFAGQENLQGAYMAALNKEIFIQSGYNYNAIDSIFIGGGTPTMLSEYMLSSLLEHIYKNFNVTKDAEVSIEVNPGTVDENKLKVLFDGGVNRISFGVQSFNDDVLIKCGRIHTALQAQESVYQAQAVGFNNINIDLMYGLPEQSVEIFQQTLQQAFTLKVQHLSIYGLKIEEGTPFYQWEAEGKLKLPDEQTEDEMDALINKLLLKNDYIRYEISNYAKGGYECKHNLKYWHYQNYLGLGAGAHSLLYPQRTSNVRDITTYIEKINNNELPIATNTMIDKNAAMEEFCFLALRTAKGMNIKKFTEFFATDFNGLYGGKVKALIEKGLLQQNGEFISLTAGGQKYGNVVFAEFLL